MRTRTFVPLANENKPGLRRVLEAMHRLPTELQQCDDDDLPIFKDDRADAKDPPALH